MNKKMMPIEQYFWKMIRATAGMHGQKVVMARKWYEVVCFGDPDLSVDVGNHEKYLFLGEGWSDESPDMEIYQIMQNVVLVYLPNPLMILENKVREALREYFGSIWETTWEEYIAHQKSMDRKHLRGLVKYYHKQCYYRQKR